MQGKKSVFLGVVAVLVTAGALWLTSRAVTSKQSTWADVLTEAKASGYRLVSSEDLSELYRRDPTALLLVDTRQEWEYRTGHMKGAVNFPMEPTWWSRWRKASALEALLGPDKDRTLIFY